MSLSQLYQRIITECRRFLPLIPSPKRLLAVLIACGVLGLIIYSVSDAFVKAHQAKVAAMDIQVQRDAELKTRAELQKKKDWLNSPEGIRAKSHEDGLAKPDEEVIHSATGKQANEKKTTPQNESSDDSWLGGVLLAALFLCVVVILSTAGLLFYRWRQMKKRRPVGVLTPRSELRRRRVRSGKMGTGTEYSATGD